MKVIQTNFAALNFGQALRRLRQQKGWTLERTAQVAGIARVTLNRWETGVHQPRLFELNATLAALGAAAAEKRDLIALMDAPRATNETRRENAKITERIDIGPLPGRGELLRAMRLRCGLSLAEAATRIGVTTRTLRFWEKPKYGRARSSCNDSVMQ